MNITVTLFAQVAAFVLFIWLINRYLWGPLTDALEQRRQRVAEGLASAEQGRRDLEAARLRTGEMEEAARGKAAEIVAHAEKRAREIKEAAKNKAREESERIRQSAQSDVERQLMQARESLRRRVSEIAVIGAERILRREVDAAAHASALKDLEERLGGQG